MNTVSTKRDSSLDKLRGFAVVIMVIFHSAYDLQSFKLVDLDFHNGFWYWFPRFIAGTFLFCVGISLQKAYSKQMSWKAFWPRFIKISLGALIISIATYFTFPSHWVYFGTLHCIALSSLLGVFFVNKKWLSLILALLLFGFMIISGINVEYISNLIKQPSMDFIPIYPWFIVVLLGISYEAFDQRWLPALTRFFPSFFTILGKKSFWIYMLHQPILYALSYLLYMVMKSR